jgi:hypothetical protein
MRADGLDPAAFRGDGLMLSERRIRYVAMLLRENLTGGDVRFADKPLSRVNPGRPCRIRGIPR